MTYPDGADRLLDEDPGMREALEAMVACLALDGGAADRRDVLREAIEDVLDHWYSTGEQEGWFRLAAGQRPEWPP